MGNRNTDNIKIAIEYANLCDMRTLLKYAKNAAKAKYAAIAYSHKTDMANWKVSCYYLINGKNAAAFHTGVDKSSFAWTII